MHNGVLFFGEQEPHANYSSLKFKPLNNETVATEEDERQDCFQTLKLEMVYNEAIAADEDERQNNYLELESESIFEFPDNGWQDYRETKDDNLELSNEAAELIEQRGKHQKALSEIAQIIRDKLLLKKIGLRIYFYKHIIWQPLLSVSQLRSITFDFLDYHRNLNESQWTEIFKILEGWIEDYENLSIDDRQIQSLVCFKNGVYDIINDQLYSHSPQFSFISFVNFEFEPSVRGKAKTFDAYIDSISQGNEHIKKRILQWMGYCVSNLPNLKKIALVIGEPNSGKSTYGNIIQTIIGPENSTAFSFDCLNRFSHDAVFGKLIGLSTDMSGQKISAFAAEWMKNQTGGDQVWAEVKHKSLGYSYVSKCKFIIASNYRPDFNDKALDERMLIIPMPKPLLENEINRNLLNDIKPELQYVFRQLFDVLQEFIENGMHFEEIGDWEFYKPQFHTHQESTISNFFKLRCFFEKESKLSRNDLYGSYCKFCQDHALDRESEYQFFRDFKLIAKEHHIKDDTNDGRKYRCLATSEEDLPDAKTTWEYL